MNNYCPWRTNVHKFRELPFPTIYAQRTYTSNELSYFVMKQPLSSRNYKELSKGKYFRKIGSRSKKGFTVSISALQIEYMYFFLLTIFSLSSLVLTPTLLLGYVLTFIWKRYQYLKLNTYLIRHFLSEWGYCVNIEIPLRLSPAPTFRTLKKYERSDVTFFFLCTFVNI